MKNKFQIKIFKFFILVSLAPLLIVSLSNLYTTLKTRQQNIIELENLALDGASEKINKFLSQKIETFNLVISTDQPNISGMDLETSNFLADSLKSTAGDINEINFIDKYGKEIIKKPNVKNEILKDDVSGEIFFREVARNKKYFSPVFLKEGRPTILLASQIENKNREMIGVISAEVDLNPVREIVSGTKLGDEGFLYAAGKNGGVLLSPDNSYRKEGSSVTGISEIDKILNSNASGDKITGYNTFSDGGKDIIVAGKSLNNADFFIVSEWPKKDAFHVIDNILYQSYIIAALTVIFILVLSLIAAKHIVKPIEILSNGAKEISKGNLEHNIKLKTKDEFEVLGEQFNNMIEVIRENERLKDEFVFIAAHELRTPVTAIKGYVSMMLDGSLGKIPDEMKKNLSIIFSSNERLVQLVQDLLEVARSVNNKMAITMKPTPIAENVITVIDELLALSEPKGIKIKYDRLPEEINVKADGYKLKEILTNLIGNAIKYTIDNGGIEIFHEKKGKYLVTHIKDHGIGISEENINKLFSKFYRVKNEKTENIEGTGLGLFICKELIERMGGKIEVESEPGKGSDFKFSLEIVPSP